MLKKDIIYPIHNDPLFEVENTLHSGLAILCKPANNKNNEYNDTTDDTKKEPSARMKLNTAFRIHRIMVIVISVIFKPHPSSGAYQE